MEECTGHIDFVVTVIMTQTHVHTVKITTFGLERLDRATLFAIAVGMQQEQQRGRRQSGSTVTEEQQEECARQQKTTTYEPEALGPSGCLSELIMSVTLSEDDATILAEGLAMTRTLRRLSLFDCTLDRPAALALARHGLEQNSSLLELGLVACGQSEAWLTTVLLSLQGHPTLDRLDLRCLGVTGLGPLSDLVENKMHGLVSLDLSFKGGCVDIPLDMSLLSTALRRRSNLGLGMSLQQLHLCSLLLTDDDIENVMEACVAASVSLRTLSLSLNKISDQGVVRYIAPTIRNNGTQLQRLYLDGNPFQDVGASALLESITTNVSLEKVRIPRTQQQQRAAPSSEVMEDMQRQLDYYGCLNRGGRRLVCVRQRRCGQGESEDGQQAEQKERPISIPVGLWADVLGRINRVNFETSTGHIDAMYCLLRHGPLLFPV